MNDSLNNIEIVSIKEFQENFDDYIKKIEILRKSFIIENEQGQQAIMMPAEEEVIEIYTKQNSDVS
jgi:PHD/YefM family antitoxin component YafN of YafNO toxin-antitoxin module